MKNSCDKFLPRFDDFVFFCNRQQNTPDSEVLLEKYQKQIAWQRLSAFYPANSLNRALRCSIEQGSEGFTNTFKIRTADLF